MAVISGARHLLPDGGPSAILRRMLIEQLLERALASLIGERLEAHGAAFFDTLRKARLMSEAEVDALEREWRELVAKRKAEGADAAAALKEVAQRVLGRVGGDGGGQAR